MQLERRADFILIGTTILAAGGWVFSKEAIQGLPPFGFIGLRFLMASFFLLPFCIGHFKEVAKADLVKAMSAGLLLGSALLMWIYAMSITDTLGEGAFIMSLSMLFVPLVAWPLFKIKPPRVFWLALPVAFAGLAMLSLGGVAQWQFSPSQGWFLAAAVMLAVHFNVNSQFARRMPTLLLTASQLFVTGCVGLTASMLFETWPETISMEIWGWFTLSMLVATSIRYVMQTAGQKHSTPANAAVIMILEPVWTVILSVMWYAEQMPMHKVSGCIMILLALFIYRGGPFLLKRFYPRPTAS